MTNPLSFYSRETQRQLAAMVTAVDLDNLQYEMVEHGATKEELMASSECHHDIWEMMRMCSISN